MFQKIVGLGIVSLFVAAVMGCSDSGVNLVRVKGKVVYEGQPISGATVTFKPNDGGPIATGMTDASGAFSLTTGGRPGAVIGAHKVGITKMSGGASAVATEAMSPDDMREMQKAAMDKGADSTPKSEIPEKYANPEKSGLVATVSENAAENEFEYTLVD